MDWENNLTENKLEHTIVKRFFLKLLLLKISASILKISS